MKFGIGVVLVLLCLPAAADGLSADEQRMADWIDAHADDAIALLKETVDIPSGTLNHDGVREVGRVMRRELDALGLDTDHACFYRQSDIPEIPELTWILHGMTAKGLMNRAHSYKAQVQLNVEGGNKDPDKGITMALFSYPILMAADILMFKSTKVPVGQDQKQHVEMARDIAQRFNHHYGETFVLPEPVIGENTAVLKGLDGRKMSKSYNNTIPLFAPEKKLRKLIMKIKTNSLEPGEAKDPSDSTLFDIYKAFATPEETAGIEKAYAEGIAWGEMKQRLFEYINDHIKPARDEYDRLIADPAMVEAELRRGAERARELSAPYLDQIRAAIGIRRLG